VLVKMVPEVGHHCGRNTALFLVHFYVVQRFRCTNRCTISGTVSTAVLRSVKVAPLHYFWYISTLCNDFVALFLVPFLRQCYRALTK
jgi:hypothetical protein